MKYGKFYERKIRQLSVIIEHEKINCNKYAIYLSLTVKKLISEARPIVLNNII